MTSSSPEPPIVDGSKSWVDLSGYTVGPDYTPGRPLIVQLLWYYTSHLLVESGVVPFSKPLVLLLRLFGAKIGTGVRVKPGVRIKFPWRLEVGDHSWIGQGVWIDNLTTVRIGSHVCISQGVYFCCGSHDHRKRSFDLMPGEITVDDGAWVAANALLLAGTKVGANALVAAGCVVNSEVPPAKVIAGIPGKVIADRDPPTG